MIKQRFIQYSLLISIFAIANILSNCENNKATIIVTASDYHRAENTLTNSMVHDIFSPPVASRLYTYSNIAAYELIAANTDSLISLKGQIKSITTFPPPINKLVNIPLAALMAKIEISRHLVFTENYILAFRDSLYKKWKLINKKSFIATKKYVDSYVTQFKKWIEGDYYAQTRTMPKFSINLKNSARWQPTPPAYMEGIEPHWNKIRPLVINFAEQFKPKKHPDFSLEKTSIFYKELKEVYTISNRITKKGDDSEEVEIAKFWDCNPYVSVTRGHFMFATKKITPGAHWIGICEIACKKTNADIFKTIRAYTKTSIALFDAFISCWDEKYRSNLIRPETLINQHIDENWKPLLQTPPFPEYTSGHSVISSAAAITLTSIFGDNFEFQDTTELRFNLPIRKFSSFLAASKEAAISRVYGGIHYRFAVEVGIIQGQNIGNWIVNNIKLKK